MRVVVLVVLVVVLQGIFGVVLDNRLWPPDLFMLLALALTARVGPLVGIGLAFAVGLVQDLFGSGFLGFHAGGLLVAAYVLHWLRRILAGAGLVNQLIVLGACWACKWLVFALLSVWSRQNLVSPETFFTIALPELLTTMLAAWPFLRLADWALGPIPDSDERLL